MAASSHQGGVTKAPDLALLQLCFDESEISGGGGAFMDDESRQATNAPFDAETFVLNKEQHIPLHVLQGDLETYAKHLGDALMKSVHEEVHDAFVAVSAQLATHENALRRVHEPILELHGAVDSAKEGVERSSVGVMRSLQAALAADELKSLHAGALEVAVCHRRIRFLLHVLSCETSSPTAKSPPRKASSQETGNGDADEDEGDDDDDDILEAMIEELEHPSRFRELATLVVRQRFLARTTKALAERSDDADAKQTAAAVQAGCEQDAADVLNLLQTRFLSAVASMQASPSTTNASRLTFVCGLFSRLNCEDKLVEALREHVVRPVVEEVVSWKAAAHARPNADEVIAVISNLQKALSSQVCSLLPVLRTALQVDASSSAAAMSAQQHHHYGLVSQGIWRAVCDTLMKRMMYLFAAGLPPVFHRFFVAANELVRLMEDHCASLEELSDLRSSPDMALWVRKWSLEVYHTLRVTELQEKVTASVSAATAFVPVGNQAANVAAKTVSLEAFESIQRHLLWWFNASEVFLFPLYPRALKDAHGIVNLLLEKVADAAASGGVAVAIAAASSCHSFSSFCEGPLLKAISTAGRDEPPTTGQAGSSHSATSARFCELLSSMAHAKAEAILSQVTLSVSDQCLKQLDHIKSLKSVFTMTKKGIPTAPSVFIADSLAPVREFRKAASTSKALSDAEIQSFTVSILTDVCRRFGILAKDTVVTAKRSADHLEKLKKRNTSATTATSTEASSSSSAGAPRSIDSISDIDKMIIQLYLDTHELGALMRAFGIIKESFAPLQSVLTLVKRADWILGGFIGPEPPDPWSEPTAVTGPE